MTKHESREYAFLLLYEVLLRTDSPESLEEIFMSTEEMLDLAPTEYVKQLVFGVLAQQTELDAIIAEHSAKRSLNRVPAINRSILRLALYELRHMPETPVNVVISEAVNLTHAYAYPEDTSFVNGVLGTYARAHLADDEKTDGEEGGENVADSGT